MTGRRLTTAVTLVVLLFILAGMAVYGFTRLTAPLPAAPVGKDACPGDVTKVEQFLRRSDVQVSVFNASGRSGLASSTLDKVEAAGFRAGNAGNAPGTAKVLRAVVWTTEPNDPAARLVAQAFGPSTKVQVTATDLGPGIDVLVGDKFKRLDRKAPNRIRLTTPIETCAPVG